MHGYTNRYGTTRMILSKYHVPPISNLEIADMTSVVYNPLCMHMYSIYVGQYICKLSVHRANRESG